MCLLFCLRQTNDNQGICPKSLIIKSLSLGCLIFQKLIIKGLIIKLRISSINSINTSQKS
jgi:hypothetical protein